MQKANQKEFRIEKVIKKKGDKLFVKWKGYDNSFNSWIDKKDLLYMSSGYFLTYSTAKNKIVDIKLNLSGYVTQKEFKNLTKVDTSDFALKTNVTALKTRIDDIYVNKINSIDELQVKNFVQECYLLFKPENRYCETSQTNDILSWKSTGSSDEKMKQTKKGLLPKLSLDGEKMYLSLSKDYLVQEKVTYTHGSIVNIYIVYLIPNVVYSVDSHIMTLWCYKSYKQ